MGEREAEAYYVEHGWSGCAGSAWSRLTEATKDGWRHVARATADAEIVRAEWERQYNYAVEAADRFRKQAADAEARLAAARALHSGIHWCFGGGDHREANVYEQGTEWWPCPTLATLDPAPTTDADGRDERRDGAGGTRWERG